MSIRFEIHGGRLEVVQSFDFPAVYLDQWAIRLFSSDEGLGQRFLRALKRSGGALVVSHLNLAEVAGPSDPRHAEEAAAFLEGVLPNMYFAMFDIQSAMDQEGRRRDVRVRLPAPPDVELLREVGKQWPDDFQPFTIAPVIKVIVAHRDELGAVWRESNQRIADQINQVRADPKTVEQARDFKEHPINLPTRAVMQELLRTTFLDQSLRIGQNDGGDVQHAISSIAYCDYVLLDKKWEDLHERMVRRFVELGTPIRLAKVFSKRRVE